MRERDKETKDRKIKKDLERESSREEKGRISTVKREDLTIMHDAHVPIRTLTLGHGPLIDLNLAN